jgi:hypothetical protein
VRPQARAQPSQTCSPPPPPPLLAHAPVQDQGYNHYVQPTAQRMYGSPSQSGPPLSYGHGIGYGFDGVLAASPPSSTPSDVIGVVGARPPSGSGAAEHVQPKTLHSLGSTVSSQPLPQIRIQETGSLRSMRALHARAARQANAMRDPCEGPSAPVDVHHESDDLSGDSDDDFTSGRWVYGTNVPKPRPKRSDGRGLFARSAVSRRVLSGLGLRTAA